MVVQVLKLGGGFELCPEGFYGLYQRSCWNSLGGKGWVLVADEPVEDIHVYGIRDATRSVVNRTVGGLELFDGLGYVGRRLSIRDGASCADLFGGGEGWDICSVRTAPAVRVTGVVFLDWGFRQVNYALDVLVAEGVPQERCFGGGVRAVFAYVPGRGLRVSGGLQDDATRFDEAFPEPGGGVFTVKGTASFTLRYEVRLLGGPGG